jgi:pimeloyl-ACP methyl ester carboxylesterase
LSDSRPRRRCFHLGWHLRRFGFRGCGHQARLTDLTTIDEYAGALYREVQANALENLVLVGHSMGGYIALAFAELYPKNVRGLVLHHSTAYADDDAKKEQRRQAIEKLEAQGAASFIEKQLPRMVAPTYPAEKVQHLVDQFSGLPAGALVAGMKAIASRPDRTPVLRDARFPILLLLGKEDQLIPYDKTQRLADLSDIIQVAILNQSGHLSMVEQPDETVEVIRSFVRQLA